MKTKEQRRAYANAYFYANHEARLAYSRAYKKTPKAKAARLTYYRNNPDKQRARTLKYSYGLTFEQYKQMEKSQNGVCAICFNPETKISKWGSPDKGLKVDHCAKTGKVRGLLCHRCNVAIGLMHDSPDRLISAAKYLQNHSQIIHGSNLLLETERGPGA